MAKFRFAQWLWDWLLGASPFLFEWDAGNTTKNVHKHGVTCGEAEQVFAGRRLIPLGEQYQPACPERRFGVLGEASAGKVLFVAFTVRGQRIRVISARPANEKERRFYAAIRQE